MLCDTCGMYSGAAENATYSFVVGLVFLGVSRDRTAFICMVKQFKKTKPRVKTMCVMGNKRHNVTFRKF